MILAEQVFLNSQRATQQELSLRIAVLSAIKQRLDCARGGHEFGTIWIESVLINGNAREERFRLGIATLLTVST